MQVYIEVALIENFCMDFFLLSCAKLLSKNLCGYGRIVFSAVVGSCVAVIFPLIPIQSDIYATLCKIVSGIFLCFIGARVKPFRRFIAFCAWFLGLTFLSGGMLIALFSLTGTSYVEGTGYLLSSVPVGVPLALIFLIFLLTKKLCRRFFRRGDKNAIRCTITLNKNSVTVSGFYDSGNRVYSGGMPVSVLDQRAAKKLRALKTKGTWVSVRTIVGSQKIYVFTADKIEIYCNEHSHTINKVKIGISPSPIEGIIVHPDLIEDEPCLKD
jgi:sigma-E processing peptidase SpoIIGA